MDRTKASRCQFKPHAQARYDSFLLFCSLSTFKLEPELVLWAKTRSRIFYLTGAALDRTGCFCHMAQKLLVFGDVKTNYDCKCH